MEQGYRSNKETVESNPKVTAIRLLILEEFASWIVEFVSAATNRFARLIREFTSAKSATQYTTNPIRKAHICMRCSLNRHWFLASSIAATRVTRTGIRSPKTSTCNLKAKEFLSLQKKTTKVTNLLQEGILELIYIYLSN